jgi:trimethylamine--corrinoid protein Co-methyltransferase
MANLRRNWLKFLSDDDVNKIDEASRRVLSEVGVELEDAELTEKLMDKGCTNNKGRVQYPSEIIDVALAGLPNEIVFSGRSGEKLDIKDGNLSTHTGASFPICMIWKQVENGMLLWPIFKT